MPQSLSDINLHIVFSTKHREPRIQPAWVDRLYEYFGGVSREHDCVLLHAGGMPDHVHVLVSLGRTISVADLVRHLKSGSSVWIHETFPDESTFQWQSGYGAFSVSHSLIEVVANYIRNQESHHRIRTFQDEFREMLRKHGREWDERYVWD